MFGEDFAVEGMVHALTLRSPAAEGRLAGVETPELPASCALITAGDIPGENRLEDFALPLLAREKLSYIGEPVALLAGPDIRTLEKLAAASVVRVEGGPPAAGEGAAFAERTITVGKGGDGGEGTWVREIYRTGIQEHWYPEPHGAAVFFDGKTCVVRAATQWPSHLKRAVALALGIDPKRVVVEPCALGTHLDGKIWYPSLAACHAALAARVTGKPAKLTLTREEDFLYTPKRNAAEISVSSALDGNGRLLHTSVEARTNLGAFDVFGDESIDRLCLGALGAYRHKSAAVSAKGLASPLPPQGPLGGFGLAQGFFAAERQASIIADTLGVDPADWRKDNCLPPSRRLAIGVVPKDAVPPAALIDAAAEASGYYRKWASYELLRKARRGKPWTMQDEALRGIGIALAFQGSGFLYPGADKAACAVEATLEKDGALEIRVGIAGDSGGYARLWTGLAADILGVEEKQVRLKTSGAGVPGAGPAALSRGIAVLTRLVEQCCLAIRKQRFRDPLPITVTRKSRCEKFSPWGQAALGTADASSFSSPGWGAAVVETRIDPVSYAPQVRGVWLAVDGGRVLDEKRAARALRTAAVHALGWASMEQPAYEDGRLPPDFLRCPDIPEPGDIPPIAVVFVPNPGAPPKGIGELPFNCVPAAFAQAVSQAMDHKFTALPLTAREVWEAERLKGEEEAGA
ncbi:MAG: conserved hypothetical xanthine dehydrogenase [Treponematales bacterium]